MDPNKTLTDLRAALEDDDLETSFELFDALDRWLSTGGFKPADWA